MKKILIISLFLWTTNSNAQSGYFDNNPIWQCWSSSNDGGSCNCERTYNYYINGDSVVNSINYKKLFIKGFGQCFWNSSPPVPLDCQTPPSFNDTINLYALVRDTLQKIYIRYGIDTSEQLLYDFNLNIGDTLPLSFNNWDTIKVVSIDSIRILNTYRKRFHVVGQWQDGFLVEGVGHSGGFVEPMGIVFGFGSALICFGMGDSAYYPVVDSTCNLNVGINEKQLSANVISIYPNPTTNSLMIETILRQNTLIQTELKNALGQIVYTLNEKANSGSYKKTIDLNLGQGIYFLTLQTNQGLMTKRIEIVK